MITSNRYRTQAALLAGCMILTRGGLAATTATADDGSDGGYVAQTIIHGRRGPLDVHGQVFNAVMPPVGIQQDLSDGEVAAVASYVRDAWGNGAPPVGEELVRSKR